MTINLNKLKFNEKDIEKKVIKGSSRMQDLYNFSKNLEYQQHFEVGQVLVCRCIDKNHWRKEQIGKLEMNSNGSVQKWIVANKLPGNLVLCRKLGIDGRPGKGIHMIADIDFSVYRYEEDPDIADAVLLDFDYDPLHLPKLMGKARQKYKTYNNKINIEFLAKREFDTDYVSDSDLVKYLHECVGLQSIIWGMDDNFKKTKYHIRSAEREEVILRRVGSKNTITKKPYDMRGRYSDKFFVSEPMTQEEALLRIKSK